VDVVGLSSRRPTGRKKAFEMDLANLKNGLGFVRKDEIVLRLYPFNLPEGERFVMQHIEGSSFSQVGATFRGEVLKFFKIYTGNKEVHEFVGRLVREAAKELEKDCEIEEWKDETE
jgi:hypothetical protein